MNVNKKTSLSCEQVYEIWKNEPDLISIIDVRDISDYNQHHIPGSIHLEMSQVINHLSNVGKKLVVIVTLESERLSTEKILHPFDNFVIMRDFNQWAKFTEHSINLKPVPSGEIFEVSCENTYENFRFVRLIDVRRPDEFNGELGHIENADLITLGEDLTKFLTNAHKEQTLIFVCRSGKRSESATIESQKLGFKKSFNMTGGMIRWNESKLPVLKDEKK